MAKDNLPDGFVLATRDEDFARYIKAIKIRAPGLDASKDSYPWIWANIHADVSLGIRANAKRIADPNDIENLSGAKLEQRAATLGLDPPRIPALGGAGAIVISASVGGGTIAFGAVLKDKLSGLSFKVVSTAGVFTNGQQCAIEGIDTGPATNLDAGTVLTWQSAPPGIAPTAIVATQTDGSGLSGGHNVETDPELRDRISARLASPPASGNGADYRAAVESPSLGFAVQKAFTIEAVKGAGTVAVLFTVPPAYPGGSRIPNATQISLVRQLITAPAKFPGNDGVYTPTLTGQDVEVVFRVTWSSKTAGWLDQTTWPPYDANAYLVDTVTSATSFSVFTATGSPVAPQVGQTIGLYDRAAGVFRAKRIGAVSVIGAGNWQLTVDVTNNVSDTTYAPFVNQTVSPWSESLNQLVAPVVTHFDGLGPGEQWDGTDLFDPGERRKRVPESPAEWPSVLTIRLLADVAAVQAVQNATIVSPTLPYAPTTGTPGVNSYLLQLQSIAAFPI